MRGRGGRGEEGKKGGTVVVNHNKSTLNQH